MLVGAGGFEPPAYTVSRRGPGATYNTYSAFAA